MTTETTTQKREAALARTEPVRSGPTFVPAVDIIEQDDKLVLLADMPGVRGDEVDVHFERGTLTIRGRVAPRQDEQKTSFWLREYGVGDFVRTFEVGDGIDAGKITAELRDGALTLHLPKVQALMPRKITVKSN
jgi:HSP20 family protein